MTTKVCWFAIETYSSHRNLFSFQTNLENPLLGMKISIPVDLKGVIKICESASHASQGVSHASQASRASHVSHASHASHASHSINVRNFYLLYLHSHKNKNKSIGTR